MNAEKGLLLEVPAISEGEVFQARDKWIEAVLRRDINATVALYDQDKGTLLGTVDTAENKPRVGAERIRDYFNHFLGGNDEVVPCFPQDEEAEIQLCGDMAIYSGYYDFRLVKDGETRVAHAKFSFVYRKQPDGQVKILSHNSGLTPQGIVNE